MNWRPLVSVIVPVFNGERYVGQALASVRAQTYANLEVLIVDDGSTDRSVEVAGRAADARCRVLQRPHAGAAAARNAGIAESRGDLVAFLDADDEWPAYKVEAQVRALSIDPTIDMVFGHQAPFSGERPDVRPEGVTPGYSLGTILIRRDSLLKVGPLSTEWRVGEFIDWYARAEEAALRHVMLPDVLLHRRVHDANLTRLDRAAYADYARIVHAARARRR